MLPAIFCMIKQLQNFGVLCVCWVFFVHKVREIMSSLDSELMLCLLSQLYENVKQADTLFIIKGLYHF